MIYIVDTSIFLRTLIKEDEQVFSDCIAFLKKIKENKMKAILPGIAISEVAWVLKSFYKFPKKKVIRALKSILKLSGLKVVDSYDYNLSLHLYEENNVKYIDCLIASLVKDKNYTVVSYDKDFDTLGIQRLSPGDLR